MKTKFLQLHKNRFGAQALLFLGLILLFGSTPLVSGTPLPRFRILIDTNQMNISEINQLNQNTFYPLATDGVWAVVQNNCGLNCGFLCVNDGFSQTNQDVPPGVWPNVLLKLNAAAWTITEDEAIHGPTKYPLVEVLNNNDYAAVQSYLGQAPHDALAYWEYFPLPYPMCPDPENEACNNPIISPEEITNLAQSGMFNSRNIFLTRSYNGPTNLLTSDSYWVQQGLNSPDSSGVVFEINPGTIANNNSPDQNNAVAGLNYCLSIPGKSCYLLLPPNQGGGPPFYHHRNNDPAGQVPPNYSADVLEAMTYLKDHGVPLDNPNLFVVLAVYGRDELPPPRPGPSCSPLPTPTCSPCYVKSGPGFLTGDGTTGVNNSVLKAAEGLQTFRNTYRPQATIGFLDVVNSSVASGWTLDPQTFAASAQAIAVHLYVDGNVFVAAAAANMPRPDVNAATGFLGDHGFHVPIPAAYRDGQQHAWDAWAISASGQPTLLGNCPMTVTLPDNVPPSAKVTAPANNAHVKGTAVTVSGWASDNVGITRAQFKIDGNNLGPELVNPPSTFSISWNTTLYSQTAHSLTVVVRDGANPPNITTSAARTVTVDNTAPTVSIVAPAVNQHVRGTVTIGATASDNIGVVGVQFKVDGVNIGPEVPPNPGEVPYPFSTNWNTATWSDGPHTLTAVARDAAENTTTSISRTVIVDNTAPTGVAMTAPANGATVSGSVTLTATASGADLVQFQRDGVNLLPIDRTGPPYSISWNSTSVPDGPHTLRAVASDYAGNSTTSLSITVTVNNNN